MKEKLRITSKLINTEFVARANIGGTWWVLTDKSYSLITAAEFSNNPIYRDENVLTIQFNPMNKFWEMEYDTEDKPTPLRKGQKGLEEDEYLTETIAQENRINRNKRMAVKEFFARHNQLEHGTDFGVPFKPNGFLIGTLELVTQKSKKLHLADRKKALVFSIIDEMPWEEQYNVALYYAPELVGKRRSDVLHGLVGLKDVGTERAHTGGKMWQKLPNSNITIADDFINHYMKGESNAIVMKIYVEKALHLGIITRGNGGLYMNGGTMFLGADTTDAVIYFTKDMESYNNIIQSEVNKRGDLPEDDLSDVEPVDLPLRSIWEKNKQNAMSTSEYKKEYFRMITRYKELGGSVPKTGLGYHDLKEALDKQEKSVLAAQSHDQLPTSKLEAEIDPSTSLTLDELKKKAKEIGVKGYKNFQSISALKDAIRHKLDEMESEMAENEKS
jgi:hypothetical protein